ncbi:uncharacterized protein LOC117651926 [Thrips palmi]|uniref:Uncharacterized protein LOC117651926 n=1 Tax=Thrips palmi TaxID=161013 RepID=A0A6P9A5C0_THRPL|nr:uncharacterized protein LOC117651926 [Thrips palmi]
MKSPGSRLARFIDCLSQFDISKFTYRAGSQNTADPLSRCPDPDIPPSSLHGPCPLLGDDGILSAINTHRYNLRSRPQSPLATDKPTCSRSPSPSAGDRYNLRPRRPAPPSESPNEPLTGEPSSPLKAPISDAPQPLANSEKPLSFMFPSPPCTNEADLLDLFGIPYLIGEQDKDATISALKQTLHKNPIHNKFQLHKGAVCTNSNPPQVYVPESLRPLLLHESHSSLLAGHLGEGKVMARLSIYYWPNKSQSIADYVKSCDVCQRFKTPTFSSGVLTPIVAKYPMELVSVDIKYMPLSKQGYKYLVFFVDNFTRFVKCYPLKTLQAEELCTALKEYVLTFGVFKVCLTDYGSNLTSHLFRQTLRSLGSRVVFSPVGYHSTSGAAEAAIKFVANLITKFCNQSLDNWVDLVPAACFAANTSKNFSLNIDPFTLLYGFTALTPVNLLGVCLPKHITPPKKLLQHFALRTNAQKHLKQAQIKQKQYFDARRRHITFEVGQKVYALRKITKRNKKFLYKYVGPAKIVKKTGVSSYLVRVPYNNRFKNMKYHCQHLKPYYKRPAHLELPLPCLAALSQNVDSLHLASWNINGFRAFCRKTSAEYLLSNNFDIICLQETKCTPSVISDYFSDKGYFCFSATSENRGYAGVSILSRRVPTHVITGFHGESTKEARVLTLYFEHFIIACVYSPYSGFSLQNLPKKCDWFLQFNSFIVTLQESSLPVIICGDINVSHTAMDIHPREFALSPASGTKTERTLFAGLLSLGFVDTFRFLHPHEVRYSFWGFHPRHTHDNIGIRLDYILIPTNLASHLTDARIDSHISGSDHAPCVMRLAFPATVATPTTEPKPLSY